MDEVRVREREFESNTEPIKVSESDFDNMGNIKTISEGELDDFLMGNIADEQSEAQPIKEEKEPVEERKKTLPKKNITSEELDDYMSNDEEEENEEEETPKKKAPQKETPKEESPEDENIYATLARDLVKANIFSEDEEDEEVNDAADFKDKFIREMNKGANNILEQFLSQRGPEARAAIDAIVVKGVDPRTYLSQYERIRDVESMDIKDPEVQETIMKQYYKSQGLDNDKINNRIQKLKDYGDLEEDSERIHGLMVKEEKRILAEEEAAAEEESIRISELKRNYQLSLQKILTEKVKAKSFNGLPVNHETANKIFQHLTVDAYRLPNGQVITEFENKIMNLNRPENFEKKVLLAMLLDNDFDMSSIKNSAIKETNNETFEGLERRKRKKEIPTYKETKSFFS